MNFYAASVALLWSTAIDVSTVSRREQECRDFPARPGCRGVPARAARVPAGKPPAGAARGQ